MSSQKPYHKPHTTFEEMVARLERAGCHPVVIERGCVAIADCPCCGEVMSLEIRARGFGVDLFDRSLGRGRYE